MNRDKLISREEITEIITDQKSQQQVIVFTNGCFDILHPGHIDYLEKAKALGSLLIIGVNSDESVQRLKGQKRPINNLNDRMLMLAALSCTDYIISFAEDTPLTLIKTIQPNVLIKGGDYSINDIVGAEFVKSRGGQVLTIPFVEGYSTTQLINKIKQC